MLVLLLAVDLDEQIGELAQRLQRHELAVHVGARAAVGAEHAPQDELALVLDRLLLEPAQGAGRERGEAGSHLGALRALTHDVAAAAPARDEQQRIDHDGLAGAGLARERGQSGAELELRLVDDDEIAQFRCVSMASLAHRGSLAVAVVLAAAAPVQLRAQQPVVIVARRMQQRDRAHRRPR